MKEGVSLEEEWFAYGWTSTMCGVMAWIRVLVVCSEKLIMEHHYVTSLHNYIRANTRRDVNSNDLGESLR